MAYVPNYVPNNPQIFNAAFCGSLAGIAINLAVVTDSTSTDYATPSAIAGAFAIQVDTIWGGSRTASLLDVYLCEQICQAFWTNHSPTPTALTLETTLTWFPNAKAIVAIITSGESYFAAQSITPLPVPTAAGSSVVYVVNLSSTVPLSPREVIDTDGYSSNGDGGENSFFWNSSYVGTGDGVTIIPPTGYGTSLNPGAWVMELPYGARLNPLWAGAKSDNSTDAWLAFNALSVIMVNGQAGPGRFSGITVGAGPQSDSAGAETGGNQATYRMSKPWFLSGDSLDIAALAAPNYFGDNKCGLCSYENNGSAVPYWVGPAIVVADSGVAGNPEPTFTKFGSINYAEMNNYGSPEGFSYANLTEVPFGAIGNYSAITLEQFYNPLAGPVPGGYVIVIGSLTTDYLYNQFSTEEVPSGTFVEMINTEGTFNWVIGITTTGSGFVTATSVATPAANTYYHVALVYDGAHATLWVNGVQTAQVAATGVIVQQAAEQFFTCSQMFQMWSSTASNENGQMVPCLWGSLNIVNYAKYTAPFSINPATASEFTIDTTGGGATILLLNVGPSYNYNGTPVSAGIGTVAAGRSEYVTQYNSTSGGGWKGYIVGLSNITFGVATPFGQLPGPTGAASIPVWLMWHGVSANPTAKVKVNGFSFRGAGGSGIATNWVEEFLAEECYTNGMSWGYFINNYSYTSKLRRCETDAPFGDIISTGGHGVFFSAGLISNSENTIDEQSYYQTGGRRAVGASGASIALIGTYVDAAGGGDGAVWLWAWEMYSAVIQAEMIYNETATPCTSDIVRVTGPSGGLSLNVQGGAIGGLAPYTFLFDWGYFIGMQQCRININCLIGSYGTYNFGCTGSNTYSAPCAIEFPGVWSNSGLLWNPSPPGGFIVPLVVDSTRQNTTLRVNMQASGGVIMQEQSTLYGTLEFVSGVGGPSGNYDIMMPIMGGQAIGLPETSSGGSGSYATVGGQGGGITKTIDNHRNAFTATIGCGTVIGTFIGTTVTIAASKRAIVTTDDGVNWARVTPDT